MTVSVIVPTRNRAVLWRSGWLLDGLAAQTEPPDELVIALDHTEDDTLDAVRIGAAALPFPVRILEVLAERRGPNPASALADNSLFAVATGDILLHLDDDLAVKPDLCRLIRELHDRYTRAVIWLQLRFVNPDHSPIQGRPPVDSRVAKAHRLNWPVLPGGIIHLPRALQAHWGGGWAVHRKEILAIGGHCLALAPFRNSDTRLGYRLVRAGLSSYVTSEVELSADHLGPTWFSVHRDDRDAIRESRGPSFGRTIANGGLEYWKSEACRSSFRVIEVLDSRNR